MARKVTTAVFIRDNYNVPSSRYRFLQYRRYLDTNKYRIFTYSPKILIKPYSSLPMKYSTLRKAFQVLLYITGVVRYFVFILYDLLFLRTRNVIVIRRFFPRKMPFWGKTLLTIYLKNRKLYWDFDDNIIEDGEISAAESEILQSKSTSISVTSQFLKQTISFENRARVFLLPTTDLSFEKLDIREIIDKRIQTFRREINICWVGTKGNLHFLDEVYSPIEDVAQHLKSGFGKKVKMIIVSNGKVNYTPKNFILQEVEWSIERAIRVLRDSHLGIMPLVQNEFTRGKGGFKAVQYISSGLPSVVSDVGFNSEVIKSDINGELVSAKEEWSGAILKICKDEASWVKMSENAREIWLKKFNPEKTIHYWKSIIET